MRHLLTIEDLDRPGIERILDRAKSFTEVSEREVKKVPALRGRRVLNLFYEASTRTRSSFELAAKTLSAEVINFVSSGSSVEKGESLKDTVQTLSAYRPDLIVIRTPHVGAAGLVAGWVDAAVVNAGDGKHEHPTQALLDVYTLRERLGSLDGAKIWIVGDVMHSRVARSNILAFTKLGAEVTVCGPPTLIPRGVEALGCKVEYRLDRLSEADVVYALRMQKERMTDSYVPSTPRVRERLPDRRPPPERAPGAHAPWPGQPRGRAQRLGDRLAAGRHRPAGRGRRRRPHGGALRAAGGPSRARTRRVHPGPAARVMALSESNGGQTHSPLVVRDSAPADLLIRGAHVLDPRAGIDAPHDVLVRGGEIAELGAPGSLEAPAGAEVLDGEGRHLFPGFVDPHVHFRTPGQEHKEDLDSGTRSAAAGGFVAVIAMPNTDAGGRLRAGPALAARGGAARGARAGRLPRLGDDRPGRRRADRDGRAARHRRARLHRRRQAGAPRRDPPARAAVPAAVRRRDRAARGGPVAVRRRRRCTRAR